jgi:Phosphotransferase enzyme family
MTTESLAATMSRQRHGKGWLAGRAIAVGASTIAEKVRRRPARRIDEVPGAVADITDEWLTGWLCRDVPGAHVTSFTVPAGSTGTSTRAALRVSYNAEGTRAGLPTDLFVKLASSYRQRILLGSADAQRGEVVFFTTLRPKIDMETPVGYGGAADERSWKSAVLMEDVAATKGAIFVEPVHPLERKQVEDLVENLARMHGTMWEHPDLRALPKTPLDHLRTISAFLDMRKRCSVGMERAKSVVSPGIYGYADRLWEGTRRAIDLATHSLPRTLLHGDAHVGQSYLTADGRMGWTDWQLTMQGGWAYDFAYFVSSACEPDSRKEWERDFLELYLERLTEHGGKPPTTEEAWRTYCQQLFYPWSAWAFTIGRAAYQPHMQPDDYSLAILRRMSHAIIDNDAFSAIGL